MMPVVPTTLNGKDCTADLESIMFNKYRIITVGEINEKTANEIISKIIYLDRIGKGDIILLIKSPGGSIADGMAIFDVMNSAENDIITVACGNASSMGAFLLASGTRGKRYSLPNSEIMIHQPLGGFQGQASDIKIHANRIQKTKDMLYRILAEKTGQQLSVIEADCDRDTYLNAEEAKSYGTYGIIDHIGFPPIC